MDSWVQVDKLKDGDSVNAETLNTPVDQLASRTEYLKRRLGTLLDSGFQSALILSDVDFDVAETDKIAVGNVVYRAEKGFRLAQARMHLYDSFMADESAFTIGIVIRKKGTARGDVLIYGKLDLGGNPLFTVEGMLQEGEAFRSGRYYLSATEPGRITAKPSGPLIYVGSFHSDESSAPSGFSPTAMACVNPQFMDIGTSHVHRAYQLMARPAGDVVDGSVVGYYPGNTQDPEKEYPSLVFGGTWTSTNDVTYVFRLDDSSAWGNVRLSWTKDGDTGTEHYVYIPAPGIFVDLDNGLRVKVNFPEATSSKAWTSVLSPAERTWTLEMPYAGKGWVDHSVDVIASVDGTVSFGECGVRNAAVYAAVSGAWPSSDNTVYCAFPRQITYKAFTDADTAAGQTVSIGGVTYEFVEEGGSAHSGNTAVAKAGSVEETLHNLAEKVSAVPGVMLVMGDTLISTGPAMDGTPIEVQEDGFDVIGGTIPLMLVYDADGYVIGEIVQNAPTYVPIQLGRLAVSVFASGDTTCEVGTRLYATAYDYAPEAIYDYVMGLHQEVDYYFPPVPAQAAGLFVNGVEMENAALFPLNPTYMIGRKTLHWMEEKERLRPWPEGVTSHDQQVDPDDDKTMAFYFVVGFQCATGPVTSLVPAPGSPIKMYTYGTNDEAYTGDLMIDVGLDLGVADAGVKGYKVAKQVKGSKILAGAVVERIKGGNGICVTEASGCPAGQGTVTISLDDGTMRNHFNEVALENAKQEKLGLFPYISLLGWGSSANIPSAFTMMMRVPTNLNQDTGYRLNLRMTMFGANGYTSVERRFAGIQLEYNVLPDYTGDTHSSLKTGLVAPPSPRVIAVPFGHQTGSRWEYVAYDPFVATTEASVPKQDDVRVAFSDMPIPASAELGDFVLRPGYLVAVRISRTDPPQTTIGASVSPYTSPVGFLSMEWTLEEA